MSITEGRRGRAPGRGTVAAAAAMEVEVESGAGMLVAGLAGSMAAVVWSEDGTVDGMEGWEAMAGTSVAFEEGVGSAAVMTVAAVVTVAGVAVLKAVLEASAGQTAGWAVWPRGPTRSKRGSWFEQLLGWRSSMNRPLRWVPRMGICRTG